MEIKDHPPRASMKRWTRGSVSVSMRYSAAGISTSFLIENDTGSLLVDAGDGSLRDLLEIERNYSKGPDHDGVENLCSILITHPHFDHYGGLFSLLHFLQLMERSSPLVIAFPEGSEEKIMPLIELFEEDRREDVGYPLICRTLGEDRPLSVGGFEVRAVNAFHHDSDIRGNVKERTPSLCLKVECCRVTVAFTGDTGLFPELIDLVRGSDLALIEATYPSGVTPPPGVHLNVEQAVKLGRNAEEFWLVHRTGSSDAEITGKQGYPTGFQGR